VILFHTDIIRVSYTLILSFNVRLGFPRYLFLQILKPETCTHLSSLPCLQHVPRNFANVSKYLCPTGTVWFRMMATKYLYHYVIY